MKSQMILQVISVHPEGNIGVCIKTRQTIQPINKKIDKNNPMVMQEKKSRGFFKWGKFMPVKDFVSIHLEDIETFPQ